MGRNFDDYLGFQPKIIHPKHFCPQCTCVPLSTIISLYFFYIEMLPALNHCNFEQTKNSKYYSKINIILIYFHANFTVFNCKFGYFFLQYVSCKKISLCNFILQIWLLKNIKARSLKKRIHIISSN